MPLSRSFRRRRRRLPLRVRAAAPYRIYTPSTPVGPLPGRSAEDLGWYYSPDGSAVYVNTSLAYIQMQARTGRIGPQTRVWREGLPGWVPILSVEGVVFGAPPAPSSTIPPPRPTTPVRAPAASPRTGSLDLNAADFLPIARDDLKDQAQDVTRGGAWFGRRDLIPPAEDPRTKLIDRALVTNGLLSPEQLVEIHTVGAEMDRVRPQQAHVQAATFRSGEAAVQAERERRTRLKEEKKAAAAGANGITPRRGDARRPTSSSLARAYRDD